MKSIIPALDKLFSFFVLFAVFLLAGYMFVRIGTQAIIFYGACG